MKEILQNRRQKLAKSMENAFALLYTRKRCTRSNDTEFPYRGNSNFIYLTDYFDSEAAMILTGGDEPKFLLFVKANDPVTALWEGPKPSFDEVKEYFNADEVIDIKELETRLIELAKEYETIYIDFQADNQAQELAQKIAAKSNSRKGDKVLENICSLNALVAEQRVIKDKLCQERLEEAVRLSGESHIEAMKAIRPGMNETEIQALVEFNFQRLGGTFAYGTIAGGGNNACILHYVDNNQILKDGDLFLLDAGMEYKGYAGDITRTFPVNGKFNKAQAEIYNIVLKAQLAAIDECRPGKDYHAYHFKAIKVLAQGLIDLGILKGELDEVKESERFKKYYPHGTGHFLGLDVHDAGKYYKGDKTSRLLQPGMVLTVEPGLYLPQDDKELPAKYRGIGIRIEDDILITEGEAKNLSANTPKTIEDIEKIMKESSFYPYLEKAQNSL